ncbi:SDR family NAD(P)-dependent oxidoreductase [Nannocystis punicea]|uniref:SDR family NAD(P)-dependent oxidoreductase n=1 Tax=Nannocystis punicea TaxID=2995304 RepID=A0ABY7GUP1_9BACT|nr:SDR family oxidoreductase [Nannocystis poenicansa]WAS90666.1 SDR family NAD(P)-dependent oxidoreductase [Nannocystis poenicansa]
MQNPAEAPLSSRRFAGKTAIVTGGAGGIGLAAARRLAAEGARLVLADLRREAAESAAASLVAAGAPEALGIACDVSRAEQVEACVGKTLERFGAVDVIVNNAGLMTFEPFIDLTSADWTRVLGVDLMGAFLFIRQGLLHMRAGAAIVNVSSIQARETEPHVAPYAAAKAALVSLTRSAAIEGKPRGIRVNAVLPGAIDTPMLWENPNVKSGVERIDRSEVGKPEDVAAAIAFLAAPEAAFVQGTAVVVDGGRLARL